MKTYDGALIYTYDMGNESFHIKRLMVGVEARMILIMARVVKYCGKSPNPSITRTRTDLPSSI